jgi:hypothetical protein
MNWFHMALGIVLVTLQNQPSTSKTVIDALHLLRELRDTLNTILPPSPTGSTPVSH